MKNCEQFLPELNAWIDGELEDSRALEAHLAECASCRALADQYRRMNAALADVDPPVQLHAHIMQGVTEAHSPKAKRRFAFGSATAVAAVAAALLLAVGSGWISLPQWTGSANQTAYDTATTPAAAPKETASTNAASLEAAASADEDTDTNALTVDYGASFTLGPDAAADGTDAADAESEPAEEAEAPAEDAPLRGAAAGSALMDDTTEAASEDAKVALSGSGVSIDTSLETNTAVRHPEDAFASAASSLSWHITLPEATGIPSECPEFLAFDYLVLNDDGRECLVATMELETLEALYNAYYEYLGGELYEVTAETSSIAIYFTTDDSAN